MDGFEFDVEIIRSDRKRSVAIDLEDGLVKVRVPKGLSESRIRDLISKRSAWIRIKLKKQAGNPKPRAKEYVSGESYPYLGKNYRLKVFTSSEPSIKLKNGYLEVHVGQSDNDPQQSIRLLLVDWYTQHAELRLKEKTKRLSKILGVSPRSVGVKDYKSRWGSCSVEGDITYNWRVILAPHRIVDYVVVHELCHLLEHNHSARFWQHVQRHVPDWKECRNWLKCNTLAI